MRRSTVAISLLAATLVVSNAWWAYLTLDNAVTRSYQSASLEESQQALSQALAIIKANGSSSPSRANVVAAAHAAWPAVDPFEKDGYLWVGRLGLRFNQAGQLVEAVAGL